MLIEAQNYVKSFYEKNLFERIIFYVFLSAFLVKIIFELGMGQSSFGQSQHKQLFFYSFLGLDYFISFRKIIALRVSINPLSLFSFLFFIMVAHGLFIGFMNGNNLFIILNDTIPPLFIGLNILRMQSSSECLKPIDFKSILVSSTLLAAGTCFFGYISGAPSLGNPSLYYPLILAGLFMLRPFPKYVFVIILVSLVLTMNDLNRTTMAFVVFTIAGYTGLQTIFNPTKAIILFFCSLLCLFVVWSFIPQDSRTYIRVMGLADVDLSRRTGSIGERQAEQDAVTAKLQSKGKTIEWVGLGFGGLYEVKITHEVLTDYGHAHYAWVWFNLRFGAIGYLYMLIMVAMLFYNGTRSFMYKDKIGVFIALLCFQGLLYCGTYVNTLFLLSGIHFLYYKPYPSKELS